MKRRSLFHSAAVVAFAFGGADAAAQSAQDYSIQASLLATTIQYNGNYQGGIGVEAQFRLNRVKVTQSGVVSVGVGGQRSQHNFSNGTFNILGGFIEPRFAFAVGSDRWFPYVAARIAVLQQSSAYTESSIGYAAGGGAGLAYKISSHVNLDLGGALVIQTFSAARVTGGQAGSLTFSPFAGYAAKAGLSVGL